MAVALDYCPVCGARLRDDEPLEAHLDDREECREQFDGWRGTVQTPGNSSGLRTRTKVGITVVFVAVMAYSVLWAGQVLLGLLVWGIFATVFVLVDQGGIPALRGGTMSTPVQAVFVLVVTLLMGYSVLVAQQLLLGLLASSVVVISFVVGSRL